MNWFSKMFSSTIGQKLLVALTGLFLCTFLIVHVTGNIQLFNNDNGMAFNIYTVFMTTNPLIKIVSYLLYASILFHAFKGLHLAYKNQTARPVKYAVVNGKANSHWTSRSMGVLGTIILVFIAVHMNDFWWEYKFGELPYVEYIQDMQSGNVTATPHDAINAKKEEWVEGNNKHIVVKNLYIEVAEAFKNPVLVLVYVFAMFAIAFHLFHGFQSGFQTVGIRHARYTPAIKFISLWVFAILIPALFAAMPLFFYFKH